jgi:hypothetical protein
MQELDPEGGIRIMICKNLFDCGMYHDALKVGRTVSKPECPGSICKKCIHEVGCKKNRSDHNTVNCGPDIMCACSGWQGTHDDRKTWEGE